MDNDNINEIASVIQDIRTYLRINAPNLYQNVALKLIDFYEKGLVYEKLNGYTSTYKISEETGVPTSNIKLRVDESVRNSLATGPKNHYASSRALFNLVELSIDLIALRRRKTKDETRSVSAEEDVTAELIQRRLK